MCWPAGKAERRYAGVTHIDVVGFTKEDAARANALADSAGITISGLGYYPNPLAPDQDEAQVSIDHIKQVIVAADMLGIGVMNTFVGRDWTKSVDDNWPRFLEVWTPLIRFAEDHNVKIGIENCPMAFTNDEWPGGKNLAHTPSIWRRMFADIPSDHFGLNYDPSHMIWQHMDYLKPLREFHPQTVPCPRQGRAPRPPPARRRRHHGNPARVSRAQTARPGRYRLGQFFSVLSDVGYDGPVCIEVEDRAYEESLESRKASLVQSGRYLKNFMP